MSPKEIIMKLIYRIGFSKSLLSSNKGRFYSKVPGEIIAKLPKEELDALQNLTAKDLSSITSDAPIEFFCDNYYQKQNSIDEEKRLKEKFDKEAFKK